MAGALITDRHIQFFTWDVSSLSLLVGSAIFGMKLEKKEYVTAAAGFTVLAIAEGVIYSELATSGNPDPISVASGMLLYIPSLILIGLFAPFTPAVRIAGLITSLIYIFIVVIVYTTGKMEYDHWLVNSGFILLNLTSAGWIFECYKMDKN